MPDSTNVEGAVKFSPHTQLAKLRSLRRNFDFNDAMVRGELAESDAYVLFRQGLSDRAEKAQARARSIFGAEHEKQPSNDRYRQKYLAATARYIEILCASRRLMETRDVLAASISDFADELHHLVPQTASTASLSSVAVGALSFSDVPRAADHAVGSPSMSVSEESGTPGDTVTIELAESLLRTGVQVLGGDVVTLVMKAVEAALDTKLELARAYEEMGDRDGARELLGEVVREGDQQTWAHEMPAKRA